MMLEELDIMMKLRVT